MNLPDKVDVVILAGAPAMQAAGVGVSEGTPPVTNRAMTPVGGKSMLQWELDAMRRSRTLSRVYVIGDVQAEGIDEIVPSAGSFMDNLLSGVSYAAERGARAVLVATSDIPLITEEAIDDFVERASALGADFSYPIVPKMECVKNYPQMRRTYLKLREGVFTGGNMVLVSVDFVLRNRHHISRAYEARKQVFKLAGMIGWGTLARVLVAQLVCPAAVDLPALESAASRLLDGKVRAVITSYAEIGEDVDKPEDLAAVESLLADTSPSSSYAESRGDS